MSDQLLETLQADVVAILKATPSLALANTLLNDAETTDSKVENAVKTLAGPGGKRGLALVVLRPEITEGEKNLPGPPLTLRIEVQCVEQPLLNRGTDGTGIRSSQAALRVLSTLQLSSLGNLLLYTDKDPIKAVQVKTGYVSDAVTLYAKFGGLVTPRPLAVRDEMIFQGASAQVTGELIDTTQTPLTFPLLPLVGTGSDGGDAYLKYFGDAVAGIFWEAATEAWALYYNDSNSGLYGRWNASGTVESPLEALVWTPDTNETGTPALTLVASGSALQLTCATPASSIRYTTDGSFPSPDKTLYTGPITGLGAGDLIRSAAYVTGMPPSDVLNTLLSE